MCSSPDVKPPPPPPAAPPVLEQSAPKSQNTVSEKQRKRTGLSRYKIDTTSKKTSTGLGGIPTKTGV